MNRRKFLIGTGSMGAATIGGVALFGGSAAAAEFDFSAENVSDGFQDGDVSEITVDVDGNASWENFDEPIQSIDLELESRVKEQAGDENAISGYGWKSVYTGTATGFDDPGMSGSHEGDVGPDNITLYKGSETDVFDENADGESNSTIIELKIHVDLLNEEGNPADPSDEAVFSATTEFEATAENLAASASGSANADPTMK